MHIKKLGKKLLPISREIVKEIRDEHPDSRSMGVDYGDANTGIAISDLTWTIATPFKVLKHTELYKLLPEIIKKEKVCLVVVGWPVNMNGSEGPQCLKVATFIKKLQTLTDASIHLFDERLSTMAVHRTMIEADLSRKKQKQVVDKMSASYILQGVLDMKN